MAATPNFIPTLWSTKILRVFEDNLVAKKICSREHEGQIKQAGDTVKFQGLSDPTISTYGGSVSWENLKDSGLVMQVDQQKYFAFKIDDIDKAQTNIDEKGSQAERSAYKLREVADTFIMNKYVDANLSVSGTITTANVLSKVGEVVKQLEQVNVSENDMFMIIPPWLRLKLKLAGIKFSINEGVNGTGGMAWTNELGIDMFVTNQVVNLGSAATPQSQCLAGAYNSIVYADQILKTQYFDKLEDSFDCGVRGLHVYGAKTIRPDLLVNANFTEGAETTI